MMTITSYSRPLKIDDTSYYIPILKGIESDVTVSKTLNGINRSVVFNEDHKLAGRIDSVVRMEGIHYLKVQLNDTTRSGQELISDLNFVIDNQSALTFEVDIDGNQIMRVKTVFNIKVDQDLTDD